MNITKDDYVKEIASISFTVTLYYYHNVLIHNFTLDRFLTLMKIVFDEIDLN